MGKFIIKMTFYILRFTNLNTKSIMVFNSIALGFQDSHAILLVASNGSSEGTTTLPWSWEHTNHHLISGVDCARASLKRLVI